MSYLKVQLERLDSDALAVLVEYFYGCQTVAFEILRERGEMVPLFPRDEPKDRTNTEPYSAPNVEIFGRRLGKLSIEERSIQVRSFPESR